jgi:hypothetical protein
MVILVLMAIKPIMTIMAMMTINSIEWQWIAMMAMNNQM